MSAFNSKFKREEILSVLENMNVSIPPRTKLPDDALEKRLEKALNGSQMTTKLIRSAVDVSHLHSWPSTRSVFDAIRRGDLNEALKCVRARVEGHDNPAPLFTDAFMDLRQTLMSLAKNWDDGFKIAVVQDLKHEKFAINLRVVDAYKLNNDTPLLLVMYMTASSAHPMPAIRWVQEQQRSSSGALANISATDQELKLLLKLLRMNARHLTADSMPRKLRAEEQFKPSFLLPLGPLTFEDLGKLNADYGCAVCGQKSTKRCAQCQTISYCSAECQRSDWSQHKKSCNSVKGGTWVSLPFVTAIPGYEGASAALFNRYNMARPEEPLSGNSPPANIHGDKIFLIKIQIGATDGIGNLLIYDRQRSIRAYFIQSHDPELFARFKGEMEGPRGGYVGLKMYRWAKRSGDLELRICLDRAPEEEIKW